MLKKRPKQIASRSKSPFNSSEPLNIMECAYHFMELLQEHVIRRFKKMRVADADAPALI